jgi:hypothetical protein
MSEPENFLARWSRRKQEAERPVATPEDARREEGGAAEPTTSPDSTTAPESIAKKSEPPLDLSTLPPIDSIDAATDVRVFLQKGVPADLTRAALRRAWAADPNIRDFIEVAENQWDFATGSNLPGFGTLNLPEDVRRRLVAEIFQGRGDQASAHESMPEVEPQQRENLESETSATPDVLQTSATNETSTPTAPEIVQCNNNAASQPSPGKPGSEDKPPRRSHGRALPS